MDAPENGFLIEEELPCQMAFFPEEEKPPRPRRDKYAAEITSEPEFTDRARIPIVLCDVLAKTDGPLPEDWLYDILVGAGHISFFFYEDALGTLIAKGAIRREEKPGGALLHLQPMGKYLSERFRLYVPKLFRDRIMLTALRYVARQKSLRDLQVSYEQDGADWTLCLRCVDGSREMFYLRIHAGSRENAEDLGERILRNPAGFFGKVIDLAVHNEEQQFDLTDN